MNVCRFHGGKSLCGLASPHFVTGRHSKYLPARLAARYQEALADPELLTMRHELALVDAPGGVAGADRRRRLGTALEARPDRAGRLPGLRQQSQDETGSQKALQALEQALNGGAEDYAAWNAIHEVIEQRRRLTESERKRLVEMQQMLSTEQAMVLLAAVADTCDGMSLTAQRWPRSAPTLADSWLTELSNRLVPAPHMRFLAMLGPS